MPWPNWKQAGATTVVLLVAAIVLRRFDRRRAHGVAAGCQEVALVSFLYMWWRLARELPLVREAGAIHRGEQVYRLSRALHLPDELTLNHLVLHHRWLAEVAVDYYDTVHVVALITFLVWLYRWHKPDYSRWRNALCITTGFCLFIRFIRVSPPRLTPGYGFVDVALVLNKSVYGPHNAVGISDQYAAMPSIHIAWAGIVCFGILNASRSRWRVIGPIHLAMTFFAVVSTANHWYLDGIVALLLIAISLGIDVAARWLARRWRTRGGRADPRAAVAHAGVDPPGEPGDAGAGPPDAHAPDLAPMPTP